LIVGRILFQAQGTIREAHCHFVGNRHVGMLRMFVRRGLLAGADPRAMAQRMQCGRCAKDSALSNIHIPIAFRWPFLFTTKCRA
jgi:hypothetical protein